MAESNATPAGNRIWLLAGLLAVVAVAGYFSLNYPPSSEDTAGTIVPAKRYHAGDAGGAAGSAPGTDHSGISSPGSIGVAAGSAAAAQAAGQPAPAEPRLRQIAGNASDQAVAKVTFWQELGGLAGRFALALLAVSVVSRRMLLRIFQIPALLFVPLFFWWVSGSLNEASSLTLIKAGIFVAGFLTVAQFSFWGNYIPLVFPLHLRGTGESFAANIGGRVIGTAAASSVSFPSTSPSPSSFAMPKSTSFGTPASETRMLKRLCPTIGVRSADCEIVSWSPCEGPESSRPTGQTVTSPATSPGER